MLKVLRSFDLGNRLLLMKLLIVMTDSCLRCSQRVTHRRISVKGLVEVLA